MKVDFAYQGRDFPVHNRFMGDAKEIYHFAAEVEPALPG